MIRLIKYFIFIFALAAMLFSQDDGSGGGEVPKSGTSGAQFLTISPDARFAGMGNAFVGYENKEASSPFYNPATMVYADGTSFMLGSVNWFAGIQYMAGAVAYKLNDRSAVGFHFRSLDSGSIRETTVLEAEGTGRTFSWKDIAYGLTYASYLTDRFSFGANLYWVKESVDLYDSKTGSWAVDLGTFYKTGFKTLNLGMSIKNFGSELDWDEKFDDYSGGVIEPDPEPFRSYHMPLLFQIGVTYEFFEDDDQQKLILAMDGVHPNDSKERINIGIEYDYLNIITLRSGLYSNHDSASLMAGFGLNLAEFVDQNIGLNYSVSRYGILGFVHQFSIGYTL